MYIHVFEQDNLLRAYAVVIKWHSRINTVGLMFTTFSHNMSNFFSKRSCGKKSWECAITCVNQIIVLAFRKAVNIFLCHPISILYKLQMSEVWYCKRSRWMAIAYRSYLYHARDNLHPEISVSRRATPHTLVLLASLLQPLRGWHHVRVAAEII